jgi:tetratricopeptide (TPR) repeat protein
MAAKEHQLNQHVAALWFQKGQQQLQVGDTKGAIESFRKATSSDYETRAYGLALANALAAAGDTQEAQYALLRLRESAPEDAEVNLDLARLAARSGDVTEASRFYHNALYGLWTGKQIDQQQREVRLELVRFLLSRQQRGAALSELLILENDLPEDAAAQTAAAELFLQADDATHALKHFTRAIHLEKHDETALVGAGEAAFQLGNYAQAYRYLEAARGVKETDQVRQVLSLTSMILSSDPLAPHLNQEERSQRLELGIKQALVRLQACIGLSAKDDTHEASLGALQDEAAAMQKKLKVTKVRRDAEQLSTGVELIARIEEATRLSCGEPEGIDRALLLIGRKYKGMLQ